MNRKNGSQYYLKQAKRYFHHAENYLKKGDLQQASEKLWGSAASAVKAAAAEKRWPHEGHRQLFNAVEKLASQKGNGELIRLFHVANSLHINFYEGWMKKKHVSVGSEDIRKLLTQIETQLKNNRR